MSPLLSITSAYGRLSFSTRSSDRAKALSSVQACAPSRLHSGLEHLLSHAAVGAAVGWGVLAALLETDVCGLGSLLAEAADGAVALVVLSLQLGAGFATFVVITSMAVRDLSEAQ